MKLPSGLTSASVSPQALAHLPAQVHHGYEQAYAHSLQTVFLVAVPIAAVAFALTWLLPEIKLRKTTGAVDPGETFAMPSERSSVQEIERALTVLAQKGNRRELFGRLATRAQLQLDPGACWLLLRIAHNPTSDLSQLPQEFHIDPDRLSSLIQRVADEGLISLSGDGDGSDGQRPPDLTAAGHTAVQRLTEAREQGLNELLDGWSPSEHAELTALVHRLTIELLGDEQPPQAAQELVP